MRLNLSNRQDGFGFYAGQLLTDDGELVAHINILPPVPEWSGDMKLEGFEPDATDFIIYADGEEVGRMKRLEPEAVIGLVALTDAGTINLNDRRT